MSQPATIIIPFRSITEGKSRLSPVLEPNERIQLSLRMLEGVSNAALAVEPAPEVLVVTPDPDAMALIAEFDPRIQLLWQPPDVIGLNGALTQATQHVLAGGARTVVVVPADLPLLRSADIQNLLRRDAPVVVAPDRHRSGTNGLMQRIDATQGHFQYHFGADSYHRHLDEAHRLGLDAATAISLGMSFDLDTPSDLDDLRDFEGPVTAQLKESLAHG